MKMVMHRWVQINLVFQEILTGPVTLGTVSSPRGGPGQVEPDTWSTVEYFLEKQT